MRRGKLVHVTCYDTEVLKLKTVKSIEDYYKTIIQRYILKTTHR